MKQRTERFEMRLTPEEAAGIREKSKRYHSVSNFIRMAVNEFSDTDAKTRLELCNDTARLCRKFQDELSWMGSNLNQAVKRANELAVAGLLSESYFKDILTRVRDKNLMIFNQSKDIEYWAAFQGRLIYLYRLVLLIPEDKLPA